MKKSTCVIKGKYNQDLTREYQEYALKVRHMSDSTIVRLPTYLDRFFDSMNIRCEIDLKKCLTFDHINRFISQYSEEYGPGSCNWLKFVMRSFLKFCYFHGLITRDLSSSVPATHRQKLSSIPKGLNEDDISRVQSAITGGSPSDLRDAALISLLATYGIRGVQLRKLCLSDIDWIKGVISFPAAKNGRIIQQPMTAIIKDKLANYLLNARPKTTYNEVFLTVTKSPHPLKKSSSLSSMVRNRFKRAGIELPAGVSCGSHGFRHAFGARLAGNVPFKHLSDMLGHKDPSSTFIYSKIAFSTLHEAAQPWPEEEL